MFYQFCTQDGNLAGFVFTLSQIMQFWDYEVVYVVGAPVILCCAYNKIIVFQLFRLV